jgi:hypothetical protein
MSERDATQLTEKIRITAHNYADARQKLQGYVAEAKAGNAHLALGYASWTAYLSDVLGEEPMRLARGERQEMVQMLSAEGMSTRAIAPIVGAGHVTVSRDIASVPNETDAPRTVESMDGISRTFQPRPEPAEPTAPKRRPLPDQFFDAVYDLKRNIERVKRLTEDDRFPSNKEKVALQHESDLLRAAETLSEVLQSMNSN